MGEGRGDSGRAGGPRDRAGPLALAVALALAGCARMPPEDLSRDPAALLLEVESAQGRIASVRGTARVRVRSPKLDARVQEFLAAEKPDRLRLETLDFFGNPAAVMVAAGGRFAFLDARANVFYRGAASPENLARLVPVPIPVEELVTILCGSAPLVSAAPREVLVEGDLLALTLGEDDLGERLLVGEGARVVAARLARGAEAGAPPSYELGFARFIRRAGAPFPRAVTLEDRAAAARVELLWREDVEVGEGLDEGLFRLEPPRGARVVDLAPGEGIRGEPLLEPPRE